MNWWNILTFTGFLTVGFVNTETVDFFSFCSSLSDNNYFVKRVSDTDKLTLNIDGKKWQRGETACALDFRAQNGIDDLSYTFRKVDVNDYGTTVKVIAKDFPFSSTVVIERDSFHSRIGYRYSAEKDVRITVTRLRTVDQDLYMTIDLTTESYNDRHTITHIESIVNRSVGAIVGIVIAVIVLIVVIVVVIICCVVKSASRRPTNRGMVLQPNSGAGYQPQPVVAYAAQPGMHPPNSNPVVVTSGYPTYHKHT